MSHYNSLNDMRTRCRCCRCWWKLWTLSDFDLGEEATKLPCAYLYHPGCITSWLRIVSRLICAVITMSTMYASLFTFFVLLY